MANNAVPQKKSERPAESKSEPVRTLGPAVPAAEVDPNTAPGRAVAYLQRLFKIMELEGVEMTVSPIDGGSQVDLTGESLGVIIGRRGETLDALQYLASLAANSGDGGFYRLVLNTGNYRQKREQTLQSLARRMAAQVVRTGRNRTLEPMNPYERRIIHTTVQSIDGVVSNSIGDGSSRRVVISPDRENGAAPVRREPQNRGGVAAKNERPGFRGYREDTAETELKNLNEEKAEGVPAPIPAAAPQTEAAPAPQKTRSEIEAFEALAAGKSVILPENAAPAPVKKEEPAPAPVKKDADAAPLYGRIDTKSE